MMRKFTLEYWLDDGSYVGRLGEIPAVFSQGESLEQLEENVREAYHFITDDEPPLAAPGLQRKEITVDIA